MPKAKSSDRLKTSWKDSGSCEIRFADGVFDAENPALAEMISAAAGGGEPRVMLVADSNVVHRTPNIGTRIGRYTQTHGIKLAGGSVVVGGGEKIKADALQSVMRVASAALDSKIGVGDVVLAIGGGSVLDVAGYAIGQVRGGVTVINIPTTPAAMVDAAYSEFATIDSDEIKDAMRIRAKTAGVAVDPAFAATVLDGVWRGGLGEIARHALSSDAQLLKHLASSVEALRSRDLDAFGETVRLAVASRVKKGPGQFALWSALRLESMSGYKLPHGYAVPIGIVLECEYAVLKGLAKREDADSAKALLAQCGALDGLVHSKHLLKQPSAVLFGLDAWRLSTGSDAVPVWTGPGSVEISATPDREAYEQAIAAIAE